VEEELMTDFDSDMRWLLDGTNDLLAGLDWVGDDASRSVGPRLRASVVGPLRQAAGIAAGPDRTEHDDHVELPPSSEPFGPATSGSDSVVQLGGRLWELARAATELRCQQPDVAGLGEAAAALQDLALGLADPPAKKSRVTELTALQAEADQQIQAVPDGPYLVTNPEHLYDHLGVPIATRPLMALCRCGGSGIEPTCDGACHRIGFTTAKDPTRVADRRDSYVGQSVTVLDNRGTCQHSGLCTDRLASVFHLGDEPFVTPSGGRLDEIVRAVRDCPSGALSYAMDTVEAPTPAPRCCSTAPPSPAAPWRSTSSGGTPCVPDCSPTGSTPASAATSTSATSPDSPATSPPPCSPSSNPGSPSPPPPYSPCSSSSAHPQEPPPQTDHRWRRKTIRDWTAAAAWPLLATADGVRVI